MSNRSKKSQEKGFTLLEYCSGAALIAGVLWVALGVLGQNMSELLNGISSWVSRRNQEIAQ